MFRPGDSVLCIKSGHNYHIRKPTVGWVYLVKASPITSYGGHSVILMYRNSYENTFAVECFIKIEDLTKLEKLIYNQTKEEK